MQVYGQSLGEAIKKGERLVALGEEVLAPPYDLLCGVLQAPYPMLDTSTATQAPQSSK
jgi:hypothetical protein